MGRKKKPESEKVSKPGVSLTPECREILRRVLDYELNVHRNEFSHSKIVQKCVRVAWEKHYQPMCVEFENMAELALLNKGKRHPHLTLGGGVQNILDPSDGGSSTRTETRWKTKRRQKSSK